MTGKTQNFRTEKTLSFERRSLNRIGTPDYLLSFLNVRLLYHLYWLARHTKLPEDAMLHLRDLIALGPAWHEGWRPGLSCLRAFIPIFERRRAPFCRPFET